MITMTTLTSLLGRVTAFCCKYKLLLLYPKGWYTPRCGHRVNRKQSELPEEQGGSHNYNSIFTLWDRKCDWIHLINHDRKFKSLSQTRRHINALYQVSLPK